MAKKELKDVDFEIIWEDQPAGLWQRFLSKIHLNFTYYQITKDALISKYKNFFAFKGNEVISKIHSSGQTNATPCV